MFPCSPVIQTAHPPLNSLQVLHQPVSNGRIWLSGAGPGPRDGSGSVSASFGSADWSHSRPCSGGRLGCFSGACVSELDTSFSGSLGGRKNGGGDERRAEEAEDEELPLSQCHYVNLIQG